MSGIFGLYQEDNIDYEALRRRLVDDRPVTGDSRQIDITRAGQYILGHTHLGVFSQPSLPKEMASEPVLVPSGYCTDDSSDSLGWSPDNLNVLQYLLGRADYQSLSGLNGTFQCAQVTSDGQMLTLVNDRFALMPLFIYEHFPVFAFAPDISLLHELVRVSSAGDTFRFTLDRAALAEWLEIGLVMGNRTLLRDVTVMPPGSILRWDGRHSDTNRYWRARFCDDNKPFATTERGEALDAALRRSLRRRMPAGKRAFVSLSGGLDSRLLLGAAVREGLDVSALTFGPEDSDDHRIASIVAERLGIPHHQFFDLPDAAASSFDMGVARTGGMANVLDLWGLQHGPRLRAATDILLNGIGGNEFLGFLAFDLLRFRIPRGADYLTQWLLKKLNPGWTATEVASTRRSLAPDAPSAAEKISAFWADCPARSPMARVYHFYFEEKSRKSNALGVATDDLFVEPVAPFLDYDVADIALQIPPRERLLARFYREYLCARYPDLAAIPYSRTGLPVGASAGRILAGKLARRVSGKRTASQSPWTEWLNHDLATLVRQRLLEQNTAIGDIIPGEIVRARVSAVMAGDASATMAVGQLLSLESFLRQFEPVL